MINSFKISFLSIISIIIIVSYGCSDNNNAPKPIAYYKISFPEKNYDRVETKNFSCEIPLYSKFYIDRIIQIGSTLQQKNIKLQFI